LAKSLSQRTADPFIDRSLSIEKRESPPFQEGAFELDLGDWLHEGDQMILAGRWEKIKDNA